MDYALTTKGLNKNTRCEVISLRERDDSLESYYISLVGGEEHE